MDAVPSTFGAVTVFTHQMLISGNPLSTFTQGWNSGITTGNPLKITLDAPGISFLNVGDVIQTNLQAVYGDPGSALVYIEPGSTVFIVTKLA